MSIAKWEEGLKIFWGDFIDLVLTYPYFSGTIVLILLVLYLLGRSK